MKITSDDQLREAFERLEGIFQSAPGTPEAAERETLVASIEEYENEHASIASPPAG